jgi:hypothetical protein
MHVQFLFFGEKIEQTTENQISQGNPNTFVRIELMKLAFSKPKIKPS